MLLEGKQEQRGRQKELHGERLRVEREGGEGEKRKGKDCEIDVRLEERKDRADEWVGWWG